MLAFENMSDDPAQEYFSDAFLRAYPASAKYVTRVLRGTPEEEVARCYAIRFLDRFAEFFGLVRRDPLDNSVFPNRYNITPLPLVNEVVRFRV